MIIVITLAMTFLTAGLLLALARLVRGPSLADRVAAMDHLSILAIGMIAVWVLYTEGTATLDLAIVMALMGFLATVALALYLESGVETQSLEGDEGTDAREERT